MTTTFADRAYELQTQGHDYRAVVSRLVEEGADPATADVYAAALDWRGEAETSADSASGDVGVGLLWLLGGLTITVLTYSLAQPGGTYLVAWGPAAYGLIRFLRGVTRG